MSSPDKIVSVSALAMAMKIAKKANMMMDILILNDLVMSLKIKLFFFHAIVKI